jgi:CBS domain-containing protein
MLGERTEDGLVLSEFADEYQDWLAGSPGSPRAQWFDFPLRKLVTRDPVLVRGDESVAKVVELMASRERGTALISDGDRLQGIFTERDLLRRVVAEGRDPKATRVSDVMTEGPETLPDTANLAQAMRLLARARYRHVPVVDRANRPIGMVSSRHVIAFVSETFPKEVLNAPPETVPAPVRKKEGA